MDNKQIEEIYNQTFEGLALFYRDTTLSEVLLSKYKAGQILQERGFTDMSYKGGGLATNLRYLIASANGKDVSSIIPDTISFGHIMIQSGAFFKVLDVYTIEEKTQVFLLEIPETAIDFFANATSNIEEDIITKARDSFNTKINTTVISELENQEWKERTEFPIGMSDTGEFFYQADKSPLKTRKQAKPWWKIW